MTPTYLQEGHGHIIFLEEIAIHGRPLQDQADDPPLVVEGIIHSLLLGTLRRLCVVSAKESRKPQSYFPPVSLVLHARQRMTDPSFGLMPSPCWSSRKLPITVSEAHTHTLLVTPDS